MCGVEADLFDLGEVVGGVFVELEFADFAEREFGVWPDVGEVEDVDLLGLPELLCLLWCHGLDFECPFWEIAFGDGLVEVFLRVVWGVVGRVFLGDELDALLGLHVELTVYPFAVFVDELDCVSQVSVHMSVSIGDTAIAHQDHDLMNRLWVLGQVIPKRRRVISVREMSRWIPLLRMDKIRKLGRVAQEENRGIIGNQIPVPLVGSELDGESSRVASAVMRAGLATDS